MMMMVMMMVMTMVMMMVIMMMMMIEGNGRTHVLLMGCGLVRWHKGDLT